jgi:hypothetical protein
MLKVNVHSAVLSLSRGIVGCAGYDTVTQLIEEEKCFCKRLLGRNEEVRHDMEKMRKTGLNV